MIFHGAVVKEQGITFAVVVVKKGVINTNSLANSAIQGYSSIFPGVPVILMAQDSRGIPTYYGRKDICRFLANTDFRRIPWREYSYN